ncbi:MAG: ABC transporter ATP-binding protein/permease, partial [Methylococcaceae bacterium]|nr:ABC transporter ATP-binding protein/permease [Methylococcaceae bacterium]
EKTLLREQQQRLGVVRLLLLQPNWIFMQDALDSLNPEAEAAIIALINQQLPHAAMLVISNQPSIRAMMHRQIVLKTP